MLTISLSASEPRSGKDTLANILCEHLSSKGFNVKTIAFGDALRKHVASMFNAVDYPDILKQLNTSEKDLVLPQYSLSKVNDGFTEYKQFMVEETKGFDLDEPRSLRFHMQHYGTDFIREFKQLDQHWVQIVLETLFMWYIEGSTDVTIVTDTRFPTEFNALSLNLNGLGDGVEFIKVNPIGFPPSIYSNVKGAVHKAETFANGFTYSHEVSNHFGFRDDMLSQLEDQGFFKRLDLH